MPTPGVYVTPFGAASLAVAYGSFSGPLHVLVVKRQHCSLLGRNWFEPLDIPLMGMHKQSTV
ncbi:hypothetical protein T4E_349 [Trichinella pseudospiralis]|uniref:Uncharacterized protein n=1 Tax=Trichinella pseudospiralis TaxID=6337 RepID=A0A0V0YD76_TRIPS|nr:hypothetical protein T4E_349 [Trichinella pseudospiralis]